MRDVRRIRGRDVIQIDRVQLVWLSFGMMAGLAGVFALGFVVGERTERIVPPPRSSDAIAELDAEDQVHRFYTSLAKPTDDTARPPRQKPAPRPATTLEPSPALPSSPSPAADTAMMERSAERSAEPSASDGAASTSAPATPPPVTPPPAAAPPSPSSQPAASTHERGDDNARAGSGAAMEPAEPEASLDPGVRQALNSGPPGDGGFTVQVSSFATEQEAAAYAASLQRRGFRPFVVAADLPGKGRWYRVRMGAFSSHDDAVLAKRLLAQVDIPAWVLRN